MALTDKVEIIFQSTGRKKKRLISWLLTEPAMHAMEANPFVVNGAQLKGKIENETFMGRPIKPQLIMRYPYLRTILSEEVEETMPDAEETVLEEVLNEEPETKPISELSVDELKAICKEREIKFDGRNENPNTLLN